jgi:hypothetical protein
MALSHAYMERHRCIFSSHSFDKGGYPIQLNRALNGLQTHTSMDHKNQAAVSSAPQRTSFDVISLQIYDVAILAHRGNCFDIYKGQYEYEKVSDPTLQTSTVSDDSRTVQEFGRDCLIYPHGTC